MYIMYEFIIAASSSKDNTNVYITGGVENIGTDIFQRGVCLPSDNKMTAVEQDRIIEVIRACFD